MRHLIAVLALVLLGFPAKAAPLTADLSQHQIAITSQFKGADLLLFGSITNNRDGISPEGDIVVVVEGPNDPMTVRKKERVGPIWINNDALAYDNVPGFYAVVSSAPLDQIASKRFLDRNRIGLDHLKLDPRAGGDKADAFNQAIVRNMQKDELYFEHEGMIRFIGTDLFRTEISLPANVPIGTYKVRAYLIRDGEVAGVQFSPLFIDKTGFERNIFQLATNFGWFYGLLSVALAALFGWAANVIFERR